MEQPVFVCPDAVYLLNLTVFSPLSAFPNSD